MCGDEVMEAENTAALTKHGVMPIINLTVENQYY